MSTKRKNTDDQAQEQALAADIHQALSDLGWVPPTSADQVAEAEGQLSGADAPLPDSLRDGEAVFDRDERDATPAVTLRFDTDDDIDATLRRAAREGGQISPEVEERMRRDRQAAEDELDRQDDGEETR